MRTSAKPLLKAPSRKRGYDPIARSLRHKAERLALYGLTEAQYQAMHERQGGLCDICARPLPPHPHIDHDHKTGRVRGLLDWWCNRFIGNHRNTLLMFRNAVAYLESDYDARFER